jgi:hypothetical protein
MGGICRYIQQIHCCCSTAASSKLVSNNGKICPYGIVGWYISGVVGWRGERRGFEGKEEDAKEKDGEDRGKWLAEREKKLKGEEGPHSPPAMPTEGPPPTTKTMKKKNRKDAGVGAVGVESESPEPDPRVVENASGQREKSNSQERERKDGANIGSSGRFGSYFLATLPRRLTTLLSNPMPATAAMSPTVRIPQEAKVNGGQDSDQDAQPVFVLPGLSSLDNLSHIQPIKQAKPIPESFLTHHTPFRFVNTTNELRWNYKKRRTWKLLKLYQQLN